MKEISFSIEKINVEAIILADGDFPKSSHLISLLKSHEYIVCCDGAIKNLDNINIKPIVIVGDCDSLSDQYKIKYQNIISHVKEQESNDLTKAIMFCKQNNKKRVAILGATGKREDHTIANVSLLCEYINILDYVCIISDFGVFHAIKSDTKFASFSGEQISIFCISQSSISVENLKYPIKDRVFTNWWQASLNESLGDNFVVNVNSKTIIYQAF